jgi:hypothetical protein
MFGVFGCQPKAVEENSSSLSEEVSVLQLRDTVNYDSATVQKARYLNFTNKLGKRNPISNYNVDSFALPIKYFAYFDSLEQAGILFQNTDTSMWVMLAVDTLNNRPKLNVCFIAKDNTGNLRYYDMTSDTTLANPVQLNAATANARMNSYRTYLSRILSSSRVDTSNFCLVSLRGSKIPYTDLQEIYAYPKPTTTKNLYCVPVIKKCDDDATKLTIDFYLNVDLEDTNVENRTTEAVTTKKTYLDFTQPCPSACAQ